MAETVKKKHAGVQNILAIVSEQVFKTIFILRWIPKYTKNDILADFIAGLTVGLTMIPQSIAYAGLAELPAQYGLYTAFVGSYTYVFFGTIKEVSIGPTSLMSLLTISYTVGKPVEYVILLTFIAGIVELLMGLLKLGFLIDFISPCLTSGFTSASTLIIISAQLKNLFGINIKSHRFLSIIQEFFQKCYQLRVPDTIMGFACIVFLLFFKNLNQIFKPHNVSVKKLLWFLSISKNAIIVVIATVIAAFYDYNGETSFKITGTVPKGVPEIKLPPFSVKSGNSTIEFKEMLQNLGSGMAVIPLVAVLANVAIAKSYSSNSVVDASQEMMSLGLCNILGSFVRAMPSTGAFTRSAVASSSDVRTPLQGIYSGTVIVFTLSFLAPYFYYIPKAVLAAVLITAVSSLLDYKIFPILWKCNKVDFFLTLGTFIIGTLFGVEAAILLGGIFNLLIFFKLWSRPKVDVHVREKPVSEEKYLHIKPELGLYYPGADYISECIRRYRRENPSLPIVLDCSNILRLDYAAAITLVNILKKYNEIQPSFVMINMEDNIMKILKTITDTEYLNLCSETSNIPEIENVQQEQECLLSQAVTLGKTIEPEISLMEKVKKQFYSRFFILQWLPKYTKNDILADLIAGLTVGLTMMPQSIAYAGLAGLPAQYGLYTAFIGSFTYIFFGTIKEVSIGPTSLMSLLTFGYTAEKPIDCVILLTLITGFVELLMGMLKLGFLVDFISPCLTSGFTSATTIIIASAQLKNLLGINIKSHDTLGIVKELFQKFNQIRLADTLMGFTCIAVLLVFKNINKLYKAESPTVKKVLWFLGRSKNAIVVLAATIVAAYCAVDEKTPFKITGSVPKGVPEIQLPSLSTKFGNETVGFVEMVGSLGSGILVVPFVGVLSNIAIAKSYSKNSIVDASQEMMSLGIANIFGSFVKAMPSSGAFTRSAVASSSDVRTPLQGLYSGAVIVLALSFLAPYFFFIPKAALAAVLIVAVSSLFDYEIFPILWKCSKTDFYITLGTLVIGTLFGVEIAILVGAIFNAMVLLKIWARPSVTAEVKERLDSKQTYLLIKPELGLTYPGAEYLYEYIKKASKNHPTLPMVLDCSNILKLDYAAAKTLENILDCYNETETTLLMKNMKENVFKTLEIVCKPELLDLCGKSDEIPEVVINIDELNKQETEENSLLGISRERKSSALSAGTIKSLNNERRMSRGSFKSDRRASSVSHKSYLNKNSERKLSIYDLE